MIDLLPRLASIPSPDSNSINLNFLEIRAYGFMIALGVLAAVEISRRRLIARGGNGDHISAIAMWAVPAGLIGARLYHVATDWKSFRGRWGDVFAIWQGGLGIPGGVLLGVIVGLWAARRYGVRLEIGLDVVAPAIPVAQAIGRLGNYFNQELYGSPSDLPWAVEIDPEHRVPGYADVETFHPTFLYEGLWNLALALLIVQLDRTKKIRPGKLFAIYVAGYGLGRLWIEAVRIDPASLVLGVRVNIWMSLLLIAVGVIWFFWGGWRRRPDDTDYPYIEPPEATTEDPATASDDAESATESESDGVVESGPVVDGPTAEVEVGETDADEVDIGVEPEKSP